MNAVGLTVLVVDPDARARAELLAAFGRLGMHAVGAFAPIDAVALLDGIAAELVVVRRGGRDTAVAYLKKRTLLVELEPRAPVADAVKAVLLALGQSALDATFN